MPSVENPLAPNFEPPAVSTSSGSSSTTTSTQTDTQPQATRMGVGPGGPIMGFDQARAMLTGGGGGGSGPANIGQVEQALDFSERSGQEQFSRFQEEAGAPIEYGQRERGIVDQALRSGQGENEQERSYEAAREIINRTYGGPRGMGISPEGSREPHEYVQSRGTARDARTAAEAFGEGGTTAAMRSDLTPGQARRYAERLHGEEGFTRGARQLAARGGEVYASLEDKLRQSIDIGDERTEQAREAGEQARADLSGRQAGIREAVGARVESKEAELAENRQIVDDYMKTGDQEGLAGKMNIAEINGISSRQQAYEAWNAIMDNPDYESVKGMDTLQLATHYTGQKMLTLTPKLKEELRQRFPLLKKVFRNMLDEQGGGSRPGRWLHRLMNIGMRQDGTGDQAREMLDIVRTLYTRQQDFERQFSPELGPHLTHGQDVRRGIRSPDEIVAQRTGKGHYFSNFMRPTQSAGRGEFANINPLYAAPSMVGASPNVRTGGYITAAEGVPDLYSEISGDEARRYNIMERLGGGQERLAAGTPVETGPQVDMDRLIEDERQFAERSGEVLDDAELAYRANLRRERKSFEGQYAQADSDFFDHVGDFLGGVPGGALGGAATGASVGATVGMAAFGPPGLLAMGVAGAIDGAIIGGIAGGIGGINEHRSRDFKHSPLSTPGGVRELPDQQFWDLINGEEEV